MSSEAQTVCAEGNNKSPVVAGVEIDPIVAELGEFKVDALNVAALLPSAPLPPKPCYCDLLPSIFPTAPVLNSLAPNRP